MLKKAEESSVFVQSWRSCLCVCVRFRCVRGKLLTQRSTVTPTIPSIFYARLVRSGSPYIESWYVRLNKLVVMHRRTLCENVDSAKIKVPFYKYRYFTRGIDASYRHTLYRYINPYKWIVTPLIISLSSWIMFISNLINVGWWTGLDGRCIKCLN